MDRVKSGLRICAGTMAVGVTAYFAYRKVFCREKPISKAVRELFDTKTSIYQFPNKNAASSDRFYVRHLTTKNTSKAELEEAIDCLTRSFAGTTKTSPEGVVDWAYCARTEKIHQPLEEPPTQERLAFFRFLCSWTLYFCLPRDGVFCLVSKETKKIVAVTCTLAPKQTRPYEMGYSEFISLAMTKTGPPPPTSFEGSMRRLEALGDITASMQKKLYPDQRKRNGKSPLYVWMFATDPECQGTGCGSALLDFVGTVADADNVECYLETDGVRNEGFYAKKGGFETKLNMVVESKGQRFEHDGGNVGMIRPAKK